MPARLAAVLRGPPAFQDSHGRRGYFTNMRQHEVEPSPTPTRVAFLHPLADEAKVELGIEVPIEMVGRDQLLQRDSDRLIERTEFGWTQHGRISRLGAEEHQRLRQQ
jgi:hypothetical protein